MAFLSPFKQVARSYPTTVNGCLQIVAYALHHIPNSTPPRGSLAANQQQDPHFPYSHLLTMYVLHTSTCTIQTHIHPTNKAALCSYKTTQWSSGWHTCSVPGKSRIKISAHKPANVFEVFVFFSVASPG